MAGKQGEWRQRLQGTARVIDRGLNRLGLALERAGEGSMALARSLLRNPPSRSQNLSIKLRLMPIATCADFFGWPRAIRACTSLAGRARARFLAQLSTRRRAARGERAQFVADMAPSVDSIVQILRLFIWPAHE